MWVNTVANVKKKYYLLAKLVFTRYYIYTKNSQIFVLTRRLGGVGVGGVDLKGESL